MAHTILLIDDAPRDLTQVTEALANLGYQISSANDVDAAVSACARVEPRLVLISATLPDTTVEDAITQVRARAGLRNTPFLVLEPDYHGADPALDAARYGAQDIVSKPIPIEHLRDRVQALMVATRPGASSGGDAKAEVLEALRRTGGLAGEGGTVTSEDLFGDLIGEGEEEPGPGVTQRVPVTPVGKPPATPKKPVAGAATTRIPVEAVLERVGKSKAGAKPARESSRSDAEKVLESTLGEMLEQPQKPVRPREDTGGASVDELLHQTLSGLEGGLPKRKGPASQPPAAAKSAAPAAPQEPAAAPPAGGAATLFGQYELIETISTGGMAEVFKARMRGVEGFQKIVAIKRILPHLGDNDEFVTMFIDEAKLAAQLQHPNIIHIYDLGKIERSYYIAMEFIDGRDLRSILRQLAEKGRRLPTGLALYIASRLAAALEYAHRKRDMQGRAMALVHRDVSPQNVLISFDGDIKLCDFGIAKAASKASHTRAGALKGKLQYMSPEQAWGKDLDHRSDIFSLGLVLYEMITGRKAFSGDSELSILEQVRSPKIVPPHEIDPDVAPEIEAAILKALETDRDTRYQTAGDLAADLEAILQGFRPGVGAGDLGSFLSELADKGRPAVERPAAAPPAAQKPALPPAPAGEAAPTPSPQPVPAAAPPTPVEPPPPSAHKRAPMTPWLAIAALIVAVVAAWYYLGRGQAGPQAATITPTPAPETTELAQQMAQQEVDKQESALRQRLAQEIGVPREKAAAAAPTAVGPHATAAPLVRAPAVPTPAPALVAPVPTAAPQPTVAAAVVPTAPPVQPQPTAVPPTEVPVVAPTAPPPTRAPLPTQAPAVREGELVTTPDVAPVAVYSPKATYPPLAARQRVGGVVVMSVLVDENGAVQDVRVLRGIKPDLGLDEAATSAMRNWRFKPATKDGMRVKTWSTQTMLFRP
jgi:TonB family protein